MANRPTIATPTTQQYFKIMGESTQVINETVERTVKTSDVLNQIQLKLGVSTPILPKGCKFYKRSDPYTIFVIEQAPQIRHLTWTYGRVQNPLGTPKWKLALPYVVFIIKCKTVFPETYYVFYNKKSIDALDNMIYDSNLCNVNSSGLICTGNVHTSGTNMTQKAESFPVAFWNSTFNDDYNDRNFIPTATKCPEVRDLPTWQQNTIDNDLFIHQVDWIPYKTLEEILTII